MYKRTLAERAIDTLATVVSPRRARLMFHQRMIEKDANYRETWFAMARAQRFAYRGATTGASNMDPWSRTAGSADAELLPALAELRNRSRCLVENDSIASGLVQTFVNNVINHGITAQSRTGDRDKDARIEAVWNERKDALYPIDDLTHVESQQIRFRRVLEDGEIFRKQLPTIPISFELIEGDRVDTPMDAVRTKRNIRNGIERDAVGRVIRYWMLSHHPGDTISGVYSTSREYVGVDAQFIHHIRRTMRPGQSRGLPFLHAVLQDLRDLDLLMLAAMKRTQIAALLALFIKSSNPIDDHIATTELNNGLVQLDTMIAPGAIYKLGPNDDISTLIPNFPTPEFGPFIVSIARRIAAAMGVSWQTVLRDFSDSTYSSARTDLLESRQTWTILQKWFIQKDLMREWRAVLLDAMKNGDNRLSDVKPEDLEAVQWSTPGWHWVDPQKEAAGAQLRMEMGIDTFSDLCSAEGKDWEAQLRQKLIEEKAEQEIRAELGLSQPQPTNTGESDNGEKDSGKTDAESEPDAQDGDDETGTGDESGGASDAE